MPACCVCVGGVNYTISCACNPCGGNSLSMQTVNANPSVNQASGGNCGGASCLSNTLNAIGKWGTALTATLQGKPVATTKTGVAVGARGSQSVSGVSGGSMLFVIALILLVVFLLRKG